MTRFTVLRDPSAVAVATADRFVATVGRAVDEHGVARVALSGGSTPKRVYPLLLERARRDAVDWSRVEFFWGDERAVPPDHPESNFGVAYSMLLSQLRDVRADRIHRMPAEAQDLDAAALSHESELRLAFGVRAGLLPAFDLIWLGMGPDGHTASLFPSSLALDETQRWVVANWAPAQEAWRMTLTFPVLNAGRDVIFVVTGADKADALRRIRSGDRELPAGRVDGDAVEWIVDAAAAARGVVTPLAWLALAVASGAAAYVVGWPALRGRRSREARDLNAERYLAWRGRARPPSASRATGEGLTADERRRLAIAGGLGLLAAAALVAFFATS